MTDPSKIDRIVRYVKVPQRGEVERALAALSPEQQTVLKARFGLEDGKIRSDQEVAEQLGIEEGEVEQIVAAALGELRKFKPIFKEVPVTERDEQQVQKLLDAIFKSDD